MTAQTPSEGTPPTGGAGTAPAPAGHGYAGPGAQPQVSPSRSRLGEDGERGAPDAPAAPPVADTYQVTPDRQERMQRRLDEMTAEAERTQAHIWIVSAAFGISYATAARIAKGEPAGSLLDGESLLTVAAGCFRCEQPLTRRLLGQPCPWEPSDG